jgi:predicted GNAT family N-acyltransferase
MLPPDLAWQSLSFLRCEWPFLFTGANRLRARPFGDPAVFHLARTDGEVLLSYADIVSAEASVATGRIDVLGLSNVFTFPPYRGEGHASAIVATAGQLIEESSADIAVLFCQAELVRFYSADGWEPTPPGIVQSASAAPVAMVRAASVRGAAISAGLTNADGLSVAPLVLDTAW